MASEDFGTAQRVWQLLHHSESNQIKLFKGFENYYTKRENVYSIPNLNLNMSNKKPPRLDLHFISISFNKRR